MKRESRGAEREMAWKSPSAAKQTCQLCAMNAEYRDRLTGVSVGRMRPECGGNSSFRRFVSWRDTDFEANFTTFEIVEVDGIA